MPIDPQSIPYQPQQPAPAQPFQAGAYVAARNANQQAGLGYAQLREQGLQQGLQDFMQMQRQQQQAPLIQAQAGELQTDTAIKRQQLYGGQLVDPTTGQPYSSSPSLSGVSAQAPQPGSSIPGSAEYRGSMSTSSGGTPTSFGGFGNSSPLSISQPGQGAGYGGGIASGPNQNMTIDHYQAGIPGATHLGWDQFKGSQQRGPIPLSQLFQYQQNEQAYQAEAKALSTSPSIKGLFGRQLSSDELVPILRGSGQAGDFTKGLMQMEATKNTLNWKQNQFNTEQQVKANQEAAKLYGDYVDKSQSMTGALDSLAQAAQNPASFNTQLLAVGDALGIKARRPSAVIDVLAGGDPSLIGRMNEALTKSGTGQLTNDLKQAFTQRIGALQSLAQQSFEQKATAHAQQNAQFFGGDVNNAKTQLFPQYQWGGTGTNNPMGSNALPMNSILGRNQKPLSTQDQQALTWANTNPRDPRAAQIKQRLGVQ